jgi:hypothetical protein
MAAKRRNRTKQLPPADPAAVRQERESVRQGDRENIDSSPSHALTFSRSSYVRWIEAVIAVILVLVLIGLHYRFWRSGGGLWRDEVNSVNLVTWSISEVWKNLQYDSFPMLWFLVLKAWTSVVGASDLAIRGLGLTTGLGIVAAICWTSRALGGRTPLVSLAFLGLVPALVVYGDTVRAFGLGVLLIVLTVGAMWRMVEKPTVWRIVTAAVTAILSVQCLYHNCILLFGIAVGAAAAAATRRDWKTAMLPLGIGAVAAASMLPYRQTIAQIGTWNVIIKQHVEFSRLLSVTAETLDPSGMVMIWIWAAGCLFSVGLCIWSLCRRKETAFLPSKPMAVFIIVTIAVVPAGYIGFLKTLSYPTQVWYYLPMIAVLAFSLEAAFAPLCESFAWCGVTRLIGSLLIAVPMTWCAWQMSGSRQTNMDVVCAKLETLAAKEDFVLVEQFFLGVAFDRYYHGAAPWATLPDVKQHFIHRYDLFKDKMAEPQPITPLLIKMQETLQSGHRVWVVVWGELQLLGEGQSPHGLPPAPNSPYGWSEGAYSTVWSEQAVFVLQHSGAQPLPFGINVPISEPVNFFEDVRLRVFEGRKQ